MKRRGRVGLGYRLEACTWLARGASIVHLVARRLGPLFSHVNLLRPQASAGTSQYEGLLLTVSKVAGLVHPLQVGRGRRRDKSVGGDLAAGVGEEQKGMGGCSSQRASLLGGATAPVPEAASQGSACL